MIGPVDDVHGDGHAGLEPVLELVGPPRGGAPGVEPPPSVVAATLTRTRTELPRIHGWFNFAFYLNWITEILRRHSLLLQLGASEG